ncbi:MAG: DNA-processing protein DprA [Dehalococcoidia bacterium]|nr:DNA-processing protein DprA [Dehalococcoidia bacterium]
MLWRTARRWTPEYKVLADEAAAHGALISELPLSTRPDAGNFPRRNRILSGMVQACLVVEAPDDSGVMWTVRYALDQGRDVYAVPGSIFSPASHGANKLIQDGAKLIMDSRDILEEMNLFTWSGCAAELPPREQASTEVVLEDVETRLLRYIGREPVHIDDVARRANVPVTSASSTLALMELKGLVRQVGGMHFEASPRSSRHVPAKLKSSAVTPLGNLANFQLLTSRDTMPVLAGGTSRATLRSERRSITNRRHQKELYGRKSDQEKDSDQGESDDKPPQARRCEKSSLQRYPRRPGRKPGRS